MLRAAFHLPPQPAEMELLEHRMMSKFEDIDSSLSLVAAELARRADDPPLKNDSGS